MAPPIIGQLIREHEIIEGVVGSMYRWAIEGQTEDPDARAVYIAFFRTWAKAYHHMQEETILFPVLVEKVEIPLDHGPLKVLVDEHKREVELVNRLEAADPGEPTLAVARELAHLLWMHIDKENSVVLPEAGERLVRSGVGTLEGQTEGPEQIAVREAAQGLLARWEPLEDDDLYRGDGCMACEAYGNTCGGIEKEWWNVWEWEHHLSYEE
jgi:hemerythrin-like domain-containing protein